MFYFITLAANHFILCKDFEQYQEEKGGNPALFNYKDYITVRRPIKNYSEAQIIYDCVPSGIGLCAGKPLEIKEVKPGHRNFEICTLKENMKV